MGKVKIKKKSTLIDMTAMSDVTVLLLTFFMLTSTFVKPEPVKVVTPSSVTTLAVPSTNVASILVGNQGQVFLSITGFDSDDKELNETEGTVAIRKQILKEAASLYEAASGKKTGLTESDLDKFAQIEMFGVPMSKMKAYLNMSKEDQSKLYEDPKAGIPMTDVLKGQYTNEFQIWMTAIRHAGLEDEMKKGEGITVKSDKNTEYAKVHEVLDNLQTLKLNRFGIMTVLKSEND